MKERPKKSEPIGVRLAGDVLEQVDLISTEDDRSRGWVIDRLLREALQARGNLKPGK